MLLECGRANPELSDTLRGRTPISWAAGNGREGIVKMLLELVGVNPDQVDTDCGQTPISWAASHGHEGVVKMLLEREGVNPDQADTQYGPTPLMWAAWHGREEVWGCEILLRRMRACSCGSYRGCRVAQGGAPVRKKAYRGPVFSFLFFSFFLLSHPLELLD